MRQEAQRLTNLVQDLITLSRIQAVEPVPDPHPVAAGIFGKNPARRLYRKMKPRRMCD